LNIGNSEIQSLEALVRDARTIGIATHTHPDGDAIGSSVALYHYLHDLHGKEVRILLDNALPEAAGFVLDHCTGCVIRYDHKPEEVKRWAASCDLLFFLDLNGAHRTGEMAAAFEGLTAPRVLIDHHLNPQREEFRLVFSETEISSASELLFHVLMAMPDIAGDATKLPAASLTAVMTGITTDTNNFANSTFPSTFQAASALIAAGVDREAVIMHLYNSYPERRVRLMGELLHDRMVITPKGVAYMILDAATRDRTGIRQGETEAFVNIPLTIYNVRMSLFLKEEDGVFRVSIRSKKGTSANRLAMKYFNGGGHEQASGGKLTIGKEVRDASDAAAYIERVTEEFLTDES